MNQKLSDFDRFIALFYRLKFTCDEDIKQLRKIPLDAQVESAAEEFWDFMSVSQFATLTAARPGSQHLDVPKNFSNLWNEFKEHWVLALNAAGYPCESEWVLEESGPESASNRNLFYPDSTLSYFLSPHYHDMAEAFRQVSDDRKERAAEIVEPHTQREVFDRWAFQLDRVIEHKIGLSLEKAISRWQLLPAFHHRSSASKSNSSNVADIVEVLEHACLAYVAGADIAALAACRAAFEIILKRIYFPNESNRQLQNVTRLGRERYPSFPWQEIDKLRNAANKALHDHDVNNSDASEIEADLKRAFYLIRYLIDNTPVT